MKRMGTLWQIPAGLMFSAFNFTMVGENHQNSLCHGEGSAKTISEDFCKTFSLIPALCCAEAFGWNDMGISPHHLRDCVVQKPLAGMTWEFHLTTFGIFLCLNKFGPTKNFGQSRCVKVSYNKSFPIRFPSRCTPKGVSIFNSCPASSRKKSFL